MSENTQNTTSTTPTLNQINVLFKMNEDLHGLLKAFAKEKNSTIPGVLNVFVQDMLNKSPRTLAKLNFPIAKPRGRRPSVVKLAEEAQGETTAVEVNEEEAPKKRRSSSSRKGKGKKNAAKASSSDESGVLPSQEQEQEQAQETLVEPPLSVVAADETPTTEEVEENTSL